MTFQTEVFLWVILGRWLYSVEWYNNVELEGILNEAILA
jgi:hypothetical protein